MSHGGHPKSGADASMQKTIHYQPAIRARFEERLFKKPRPMGNGRARTVGRCVANGTSAIEIRYVLMDYSAGNKQLKSKMMTRLEAWNRNETLKGTGFAWAQCGR